MMERDAKDIQPGLHVLRGRLTFPRQHGEELGGVDTSILALLFHGTGPAVPGSSGTSCLRSQ